MRERLRPVEERQAVVDGYVEELRSRAAEIQHAAADFGGKVLPEFGCERDGVAIKVWANSLNGRIDVIAAAESGRRVYRVVRNGFVIWSDGLVSDPDDDWYEIQ